jgi:hypothetical protein
MRAAPIALRSQPADVSAMYQGRRTANAFVTPPRNGAQQPFGREERHLRVVGDRPAPAISDIIVCDPRRSVFVADQINAVELNRRAQRVANRATQQTAGEMLQRSPAFRFIGVRRRIRIR